MIQKYLASHAMNNLKLKYLLDIKSIPNALKEVERFVSYNVRQVQENKIVP